MNFHIYHIIVSKWKHGIGHIDIITLKKELDFISTSIKELINIDDSSHKNAIVIFITKKGLKTDYNNVTEDDDGNRFELSYYKNSIYNYSNKFMFSWWGIYSYLNTENFRLVILKF